jgi:hypothetical protein
MSVFNVFMLRIGVLSVIMVIIIMLTVVAPLEGECKRRTSYELLKIILSTVVLPTENEAQHLRQYYERFHNLILSFILRFP